MRLSELNPARASLSQSGLRPSSAERALFLRYVGWHPRILLRSCDKIIKRRIHFTPISRWIAFTDFTFHIVRVCRPPTKVRLLPKTGPDSRQIYHIATRQVILLY